MRPSEKINILIAAGGTGGHLYPAAAFAESFLQRCPQAEIAFVGKGLSSSRFFDQKRFCAHEVASATPFGKNKIRSLWEMGKGIAQSFSLLHSEKPKVVIGFGSYHAFPVLFAAALLRIPLILFESNVYPGKVIRLLSRFAQFTAVQFKETGSYLKGKVIDVAMPDRCGNTALSKEGALRFYGLVPNVTTLLIVGGSQGAKHMNALIAKAAKTLEKSSLQIIHLTGNEQQVEVLQKEYAEAGILASVKVFETEMSRAWKAADFAVCRSGAGTLSELIRYEVPSLLIPFPYGAEDHQTKNAIFLAEKVGGAVWIKETLFQDILFKQALNHLQQQEATMKPALKKYQQQQTKKELSDVVYEAIQSI